MMGIFSGGGGVWRSAEAKRCDHCGTAAAVVFCGAHGAFLCTPCDAACHDERLLRHERSWICDMCEQNPAAFTCRADAANLCPDCDRDVHAANPLARRHHRVPAVPFYDAAESFLLRAAPGGHVLVSGGNSDDLFTEMENCVSRDNGYMGNNAPMTAKITETDTKSSSSSLDHFLFSDIIDDDQFFEFDLTLRTYGDSIVPVQTSPSSLSTSTIPVQKSNPHDHHLLTKNQFELYNHNPSASYCNSFNTQSLSASSSTLDSSNSFSKQSISFDEHATTTAKDVREAKVMRYREKRKKRKFEKTVRYASRKAYAESRPRIKGRFAKRSADYQSDLDFDDDGDFGGAIITANYVVPSFLNDDNLNIIYA